MNFSAEHWCSFCDKTQQQNTAHDHFLQCNNLRLEKTKWIGTLRTTLSKLFTPSNISEAILDRVYNYYDSNLRDTKKFDFEENHSYDSRSDSEWRTASRQGQRRIIELDSEQNTDDETSTLNHSRVSQLTKNAAITHGRKLVRIRWRLYRLRT